MKSLDQQNYLVIRGFCYIRPLYNEVPLYLILLKILTFAYLPTVPYLIENVPILSPPPPPIKKGGEK